MHKKQMTGRLSYEAPLMYDIEPLYAPWSILGQASADAGFDPIEEETDPNV